jgi:cell division protein FtsL
MRSPTIKKFDKFIQEQEKKLQQQLKQISRLEKVVYKIAEAINLKVA